MSLAEFIGFIASTLSVIYLIPQIIKIIKTKSVRDLSFFSYALFALSQIFWLVYGIMILSRPVIITNAITTLFALTLLILKTNWK